jgi:hypothetical protein
MQFAIKILVSLLSLQFVVAQDNEDFYGDEDEIKQQEHVAKYGVHHDLHNKRHRHTTTPQPDIPVPEVPKRASCFSFERYVVSFSRFPRYSVKVEAVNHRISRMS